MIRNVPIVGNDEYTTLISEFVLVSTFLDHSPSEPGITREEGIAVLYLVS
jgi:hypothetical protein